MNTKDYINNYKEWIQDEIGYYISEADESDQKILRDVTFKFPSANMKEDFGTNTALFEDRWNKLGLFYDKVCCHMIGRKHLQKDNDVKPQVWAFFEPIDHKFASRLGKLNDLHFHTIWIIDKDQEEVLNAVRNKVMNMREPHFSDIYVQPLEFEVDEAGNIQDLSSYNLKFQRILEREPEIALSIQKFPKH